MKNYIFQHDWLNYILDLIQRINNKVINRLTNLQVLIIDMKSEVSSQCFEKLNS